MMSYRLFIFLIPRWKQSSSSKVQLQKEKKERKINYFTSLSINLFQNKSFISPFYILDPEIFTTQLQRKKKREKNYTIFHKHFNSTVLLGTKVDQLVPEDVSSFIHPFLDRKILRRCQNCKKRKRKINYFTIILFDQFVPEDVSFISPFLDPEILQRKEKKRKREKNYTIFHKLFNSTILFGAKVDQLVPENASFILRSGNFTTSKVQLQKKKKRKINYFTIILSINLFQNTRYSSLLLAKEKKKRKKNYTIFYKLFNSTVLLGAKVDQLVPEDASSFIGKLRHGLETAAKEREREREVVDSIQ